MEAFTLDLDLPLHRPLMKIKSSPLVDDLGRSVSLIGCVVRHQERRERQLSLSTALASAIGKLDTC